MSLSDLVLSIADNKQMLGLRYAEWATRAPSLEADIAAAAMGLDDLGHSRVLYGCLEPSDPTRAGRSASPIPPAFGPSPTSMSHGLNGRSSSQPTPSSTLPSQR